jgi:hypothetical protein
VAVASGASIVSGGGAQAARIELVSSMLPVTEKISFKASRRVRWPSWCLGEFFDQIFLKEIHGSPFYISFFQTSEVSENFRPGRPNSYWLNPIMNYNPDRWTG